MDGHREAGEVMAGPQGEAGAAGRCLANLLLQDEQLCETWLPYLRSGLNY